MNTLIKNCLGLAFMIPIGSGIWHLNQLHQHWPKKMSADASSIVEKQTASEPDTARMLALQNGVPLAPLNRAGTIFGTSSAVNVMTFNQWLSELAARHIDPAAVSLHAAEAEGKIVIDSIEFN